MFLAKNTFTFICFTLLDKDRNSQGRIIMIYLSNIIFLIIKLVSGKYYSTIKLLLFV